MYLKYQYLSLNINTEQKLAKAVEVSGRKPEYIWFNKTKHIMEKNAPATMAPTMAANQNHKEIPGNPSTATSSKIKLSDRSNGKPLRVLSEDDWKF